MMTDFDEVAVFDIGGTNFRSGLWSPHAGLREVRRRDAINYLNTPHINPAELQFALADYLLAETVRLTGLTATPNLNASISMGAPVNARSEILMQSGPLWGPHAQDFDLLTTLRERLPQVSWTICNDVTASLLRYVGDPEMALSGRVLLITVSTGIAARLYDCARQAVPLDPVHGLQGEIGHLRVEAQLRGKSIPMICDCGGEGHLNAYSSGRGMASLLACLDRLPLDLSASRLAAALADPPAARRPQFVTAVREGDPAALELLDFITRPLANILSTLLTCDPLMETIVLTGGVVDALGNAYVDSLNRQFCAVGLFQISERDPDYLKRRLRLAPPDDDGGLVGAGRLAHMRVAPYAYR